MNGGKAQKGWLSRWTRKQWSRHWFVLKNGSLTYYRGPAAELCSFLDGVLDLSLIKHIEVQRCDKLPNLESKSSSSSKPGGGKQANSLADSSQFTFSLKMWNGECHILGAESSDERQLWLEAINACSNGDSSPSSALEDDPATDSSSESSPTSNLSAKSLDLGFSLRNRPRSSIVSRLSSYQVQESQPSEQQVSLDQLAQSIKSSLARSRAAADCSDVLLELERPHKAGELEQRLATHRRQQSLVERHLEVSSWEPSHHQSSTTVPVGSSQSGSESSQQEASEVERGKQEAEKTPDGSKLAGDGQAFKRRLLCSQATRLGPGTNSGEPKLVARPSIELAPSGQDETMGSSSDLHRQDNEEEKKSDSEEFLAGTGSKSAEESNACKQGSESKLKKRVTFDLTSLKETRHHDRRHSLSHRTRSTASGSESSADEEEEEEQEEQEEEEEEEDDEEDEEENELEDEDTDCSLSCSSVSSSSSCLSTDEADEAEIPPERTQPGEEVCMLVDNEASSTSSAQVQPEAEEESELVRSLIAHRLRLTRSSQSGATEAACQTDTPQLSEGNAERQLELERRLEKAQLSVGELESKLSSSYVSYGQLDQSYQRLQASLAKCDQSYKDELARLEARVAELERELVDNEQRLAESRLQLLQVEQLAAARPAAVERPSASGPASGAHRPAVNKALSNWLRATGQQQVANQSPLLLMQHMKHSMAANQQALSLKLLSQSRQIQRKLNQLELKVDKIESKRLN